MRLYIDPFGGCIEETHEMRLYIDPFGGCIEETHEMRLYGYVLLQFRGLSRIYSRIWFNP